MNQILMQVKMGGNSPGIDGNLHMVRVETEYEKGRYGSVGVTAVRNGSTRAWPSFTSFSFMFAGAGESGIRCRFTRVETRQNGLLWGLHSGNAVTHSRISNRVHMELKPYRPCSTRIDPHCNPCQFLMDSGSMIRRRKKVLVMFKIFTRISIPYWYPYWPGSNCIDPHQPAM
jgi:hypothetical protein